MWVIIPLILIIGFAMGVCLGRWDVLADKFFEFSVIDLLSLLTTVILASFGAVYLNRKSQHLFRTREIVLEALDDFNKAIRDLYAASNDCIYSRNQENENKVVSLFKISRQRFAIFFDASHTCKLDKQLKKNGADRFERMKKLLREINNIVTDDPFGKPDKEYSRFQIISFESAFSSLYKEISTCKLNLFC